MKTKLIFLPELLLVALVVIGYPKLLRGQSTFDAITFGTGIDTVGYFGTGCGWTFVPAADLSVVSVACFPAPPGHHAEVDFWDGTNQILANYVIEQSVLTNYLNYQPISGMVLRAGWTYGISVRISDGPGVPVTIFARQGFNPDGYVTFDTSPYLGNFGNFGVTTNGQWSPFPAPPLTNYNILLLGPSFQFQVLPRLSFTITSTNSLVLSWLGPTNAFLVQQSPDLSTTNWVTMATEPGVVESQNQVIVPKPQGTTFYRLKSK